MEEGPQVRTAQRVQAPQVQTSSFPQWLILIPTTSHGGFHHVLARFSQRSWHASARREEYQVTAPCKGLNQIRTDARQPQTWIASPPPTFTGDASNLHSARLLKHRAAWPERVTSSTGRRGESNSADLFIMEPAITEEIACLRDVNYTCHQGISNFVLLFFAPSVPREVWLQL